MNLSPEGLKVARTISEIDEIQGAVRNAPAVPVTQNNYGYWASVIDAVTTGLEGDRLKGMRFATAEGLKMAGANKKGVDDAMYAMFGHAEYDPMTRMFG